MALSKISFIKGDGGLSKPLASNEGISGMIFYVASLPAGAAYGEYKLTSDKDVEDVLGITATTEVIKYHVEEFYRQSESVLYVSLASGTTDFAEVTSLRGYSEGDIKQVGIFNESDFLTTDLSVIQSEIDLAQAEYEPLVAVYSAPLASGVTVEDLADLKGLSSPGVSYSIGEDRTADSTADKLRVAGEILVGSIGSFMGSLSKASIMENVGWIRKFNLVEGLNFVNPGFIDGSLISSKSKTFLNTIDGYAYLFVRKFVGLSGSFHNYDYTATVETSDFQTLSNNRVWNAAFRRVYIALLPEVNSPLYVNDAGQLDASTITYFNNLAGDALKTMEDAKEISGYKTDINPDQNVLSNSKIEITVFIQPVGVAKFIEVTMGFTLKI